jgi:Zn-dependent peptidase ImmA (M78 family)/transcriptional regulator with XRE-family HTH domain
MLASSSSVPRVRTRSFSAERLVLARQLRGLTQVKLAHRLGVSAAAISQFEAGAAVPAAATLERLGVILKVRPAFLARPTEIRPQSRPFFRAVSSTPAADRDRAAAYALVLSEVAASIERHVELPPLQVTSVLDADDATSGGQIETAAAEARTTWGVPPGPIADVINLAEARGIVVAAVGDFNERMDAFSLRTNQRPVVVLCTAKGVAARRRFDMAHELGHMVLHSERLSDPRCQEAQAHRFAAALLMPKGEIEPFLPRNPNDLRALEETSKTWGVSMQAALYRARQLALLAPEHYTKAIRRLSAAGWRRREPIEIGPAERPRLLAQAVVALPDAGVSLAQLAEEFGVAEGRLARMLALPEDSADVHADVVELRPRRSAAI